MPTADLDAARANAHAIAFRLLGDRSTTRAVVDTSLERARAAGDLERPDWLCAVAEETVAGSVGLLATALTGSGADDAVGSRRDRSDAVASQRAALRDRLAAATPDERVAASLHHLAGYPIEAVAVFMGRPTDEVARLAEVLRPPTGESYRFLGDPDLVGSPPENTGRRLPRISRSTGLSVLVVIGLVLGAGRCVGERPTLGPVAARVPVTVGADVAALASPGCNLAGQSSGASESTAAGPAGPVPFRLTVPSPVPAQPVAPTSPAAASSPGRGAPVVTTVARPLLLTVTDSATIPGASTDPGPEPAALAAGYVVATTAPRAGGVPEGGPEAAASVASVIRHVFDHACIDESRVTVTGLGAGAQTATLLACAAPDLVTVAAPVAGASMSAGCRLSPAVSLLLQWNADDVVMPPTGGYGPAPSTTTDHDAGSTAQPAGLVAKDWAAAIGAAAPERTVESDGTSIEQATSAEGAGVRSVIRPTGGHVWSTGTTEAILEFSAAHARAPRTR